MSGRSWSKDEEARLTEMLAASEPFDAIADELGRTVNAVEVRRSRLGLAPKRDLPAWKGSPTGNKLYWTRERCLEGMRDFIIHSRGKLPQSNEYNVLKVGHMEWPPSRRVLQHFGSMAKAWRAAGAPSARVSDRWTNWSAADDEYLLEHAGEQTLRVIGRALGRSAEACKRRIYDMGIGGARDNSEYLSGQQVAEEYQCPVTRVYDLIRRGELKAHRVKGGHYWRISPEDAEEAAEKLRAPKRTYTSSSVVNVGDYHRRYGLRRVRINGRTVRVAS